MNVLKRSLGILRIPEFSGDGCGIAIGVLAVSKRSISGKVLRERIDKPAPFPYETKNFHPFFHGQLEDCRDRFDENSAVLFVDGMPSAGKSKLAAGLAEQLEMKHYPAVSMDTVYKNEAGDDLRNYKQELHGNVYPWDVTDFLSNPTSPHNARLQIQLYKLRFMQYADALTHLMSTGQGVVLEQNAYSDVSFTQAMIECGYLSKRVEEWYKALILSTHAELLHPHLTIFLDVPVEETEKRLVAKYGSQPPALNRKFLESLDKNYKQSYLPEMSHHSDLLIYDWSEMGDEEVVVEDIERINFDRNLDPESLIFKDWRRLEFRSQWNELRYRFQTDRDHLDSLFNLPTHRVPELFVHEEDKIVLQEVKDKMGGERYASGFNPKLGDFVLFKVLIPEKFRVGSVGIPTAVNADLMRRSLALELGNTLKRGF